MRTITLGAAVGCTLVFLGCSGGTPTAPTAAVAPIAATASIADQASTAPVALAQGAGMQKTPISGTMDLVGITAPSRVVMTPSGMCHFFNLLEFTEIHGDLEGTITYDAGAHRACDDSDLTHLVASGPFTGEITFQGRTGPIKGQWTTNCKIDASLGSLSCDGTMTFRGTGELEGVQVHYNWGPGWWPFSYAGTAFSK